MFNIVFPEYNNQECWHVHYKYILDLFKYLNCNITYQKRPELIITINNKDFYFDFYDFYYRKDLGLPTFKFHCREEKEGLFAFPPVSFFDWNQYYHLEKEIEYHASGNLISYRQIPGANAYIRRTEIKTFLNKNFKGSILNEQINQIDYWKEINKIKISVCVPGWCNNMTDRGQLQYMGFGCCTVSPNLPEKLPFANEIIPDFHYIRCQDNYSDLIDILNNLIPKKCIEIGQNAKYLFKNICTPEILKKWIESKL
jgi:hypothetical protein